MRALMVDMGLEFVETAYCEKEKNAACVFWDNDDREAGIFS